uniref:natriuretic peptides B n=1 Tax=Doryrhamphus excisus TaxID=161450 RepID=UPI0025ADFF85|nr:natriuretic peptides B [Doryrhamphus excisus]
MLSSIIACSFLLILHLQLPNAYPVSTSLTTSDMDILEVLLHKLEESLPVQTKMEQRNPVDNLNTDANAQLPLDALDEPSVREFLSAKNLKSIRSDTSRKYSSCFGRRMDRVGSMSSLGCNSVGKNNSKSR